MKINNKTIIIIVSIVFTGLIIYKIFKSNNKVDKKLGNAIKIMCIGDSLTDNYDIQGSFRKYLYNGLRKKGFNIEMVGTKDGINKEYKDEMTGESFIYNDANVGYSGFFIKSFGRNRGIYNILKKTNCISSLKPNIIILLIGTNNAIVKRDPKENSADFELLLNYIIKKMPSSSILFVSTIPYVDPNKKIVLQWFESYRHSEDWHYFYSDEEVEKKVREYIKLFNLDITARVNKRKQKGQPIRIANINSVVTDVKSQLSDGVHPNDKCYKAIGKYWTKIIGNYLNEK